MKTCVGSADSGTDAIQASGGGAGPTPTLFRKADWWVDEVSMETLHRIVQRWHYSGGGSNTAVARHGLFPRDWMWESQCVGVAWWLPTTVTAARALAGADWRGVLCLTRLAIDDSIPKNAESFLLRHSMRKIDRKRWPFFVTYADDWQGHKGTIYRAAGWKEHGKTKPERRYTLNGRLVCRKAGPRTRSHAEMLALGAVYLGKFSATRFIHVA